MWGNWESQVARGRRSCSILEASILADSKLKGTSSCSNGYCNDLERSSVFQRQRWIGLPGNQQMIREQEENLEGKSGLSRNCQKLCGKTLEFPWFLERTAVTCEISLKVMSCHQPNRWMFCFLCFSSFGTLSSSEKQEPRAGALLPLVGLGGPAE